jgi:NAD(P)-dependent dehydrogenase (short-subunit alcohol dehydrogenase family)
MKIAIVTGAGSGIGRAVSLALLKDGYSVVLAGRRAHLLEQVATESGAGSRALAIPTDVTQPESVRALFARTKAAFGRLDLLFNNAGINPAAYIPFEDLTYAQWTDTIETNLNGIFLCAQAAFRLMKEQQPQGGRIINNGSVSAQAPRPDYAPYTASKCGVSGLTKCLCIDGRPYNIACAQIDIGNALTDLSAKQGRGVKQANGTILAEPMIDAKHVVSTVLHLANLPLDANMPFTTIMATNMPLIGRG